MGSLTSPSGIPYYLHVYSAHHRDHHHNHHQQLHQQNKCCLHRGWSLPFAFPCDHKSFPNYNFRTQNVIQRAIRLRFSLHYTIFKRAECSCYGWPLPINTEPMFILSLDHYVFFFFSRLKWHNFSSPFFLGPPQLICEYEHIFNMNSARCMYDSFSCSFAYSRTVKPCIVCAHLFAFYFDHSWYKYKYK